MIVRTRKPKDFFKEYGLDSSAYGILDIMKLMGVEIVSVNKKYEDYILTLSIPNIYDKEFFGLLNQKDICNFLENKINNEVPSEYKVGIIIAHGRNPNRYWEEMDFFDAKHKIINKSVNKFIDILDNTQRPIRVHVKRKRIIK